MDGIVTAEEIRRAFPTRVTVPPVTVWYRLGLVGVAIALVLLQAAYVALVLGAAAATWLYAGLIPDIVSTLRFNVATIVLVVGPIAAGLATTFFLVKPLLARAPQPPQPHALTPEEQPELHAWVAALCQCLGSPAPASIEVNLEANASASLRRGLRSLFSNDLRLIIGLPLASSLTLRQFTGVLAHEFGHFSQKTGIRSWYLIQRVQHWFARVAYERDEWDRKLDRWREESKSNVVILVLGLAALAVRFSRAILRGLLYVARAASSALSRQMEFDADRHEAALVGAETFEQTMFAIPMVNAAVTKAWEQVERGWRSRKLGVDFPAMVDSYWRAMPDDLAGAIRSALVSADQGRFDTHPSHQARVANVREWNPPGALAADGPATRLFRDFAGLCSDATSRHYQAVLGAEFAATNLAPVEDVIGDVEREATYEKARRELLGEHAYASRWVTLGSDPWENPPAAMAAYAVVAARTYQDATPPEIDDQTYANLLDRSLIQSCTSLLEEPGAEDGSAATHREIEELERGFHARIEKPLARIRAAFDCLASGAITPLESVEVDPREAWLRYARLTAHRAALWKLRESVAQFGACIGAEKPEEVIADREAEIRKATAEIADRLGIAVPDALEASQDAAVWLMNEADQQTADTLNRICWTTLRIEAAVREHVPPAPPAA